MIGGKGSFSQRHNGEMNIFPKNSSRLTSDINGCFQYDRMTCPRRRMLT